MTSRVVFYFAVIFAIIFIGCLLVVRLHEKHEIPMQYVMFLSITIAVFVCMLTAEQLCVTLICSSEEILLFFYRKIILINS